MIKKRLYKFFISLIIFSIPLILLISWNDARTATNTVSNSAMDDKNEPLQANHAKPAECNSLNLTSIHYGKYGDGDNDLIIGSSGIEEINGLQGNDCILGGNGNDRLDGGSGTDVCIGGGGTDTFNNCETIIQ